MSQTYAILTLGCQMNEADSRHLGSQLESLGYAPSDHPDEADLVVLNTCVVRQQAEDKAVNKMHALKRSKEARPEKIIALMGCMVGMREAPGLKERFPFIDVFMPPSETRPLLDFLGERQERDPGQMVETREKALRNAIQDEDYILPALQQGQSVTAHVPVVLGCSHACTFCVIPYRRGAERSRPREDILHEVRRLAEQGIREVTLLGQIVDRYGLDLDEETDLADLLGQTAAVEGLERVRFLTSHPNWMTERLIDAVAAHPAICPQFEIPSQAGNNEVLERMRRGYTVEAYEEVIAGIRNRIPDAAIHTDIIVGFPGETPAQFEDTVRHIERVVPDKLHLAKYSERPKTLAARNMPDDIDAEEKESRRRILEERHETLLAEKASRLQDTTVEVLVDGRDERRGRWRGRTPQGKLVYFEDERPQLGRVLPVQISWAGPYSLVGHPTDNAPEPIDTP